MKISTHMPSGRLQPEGWRHATALAHDEQAPGAASFQCTGPIAPGLLVAEDLGAELDALSALEATMGGPRFWNPATLDQVAQAVLDVYLDRAAGGTSKQMGRLAELRKLKVTRPAWDRIEPVRILLRRAPIEQRRALAYAAGLPLELLGGFAKRGGAFEVRDKGLLWLPEGLAVPGSLLLGGTALTRIPKGLEVGGKLDLGWMTLASIGDDIRVEGDLYLGHARLPALPKGLRVGGNLWMPDTDTKSLPEDLSVGGMLICINTPLSSLSDSEIRAMAPGIQGTIVG